MSFGSITIVQNDQVPPGAVVLMKGDKVVAYKRLRDIPEEGQEYDKLVLCGADYRRIKLTAIRRNFGI